MKTKLLNIALGLSVLILLVGFICIVQHWPFGREIERIALVLIVILYSTRYLNKKKITLKDALKIVLVFSWCALSVIGPLGLFNIEFIIYLVMLLGLFWFILESKDMLKHGLKGINMILFAGVLLLALETLMRMQFWPLSSMVHLVALLIISVGFFVDSYFKKEQDFFKI